ncbi:hypothetical protein LIER_38269 [Lithospermum erythrorhizon]|uniref:Uncharacterized protein n=1 Tax=Lithospermum erythrorhizon TaxID=34254 RepID=A0AAV3Q2G9_LITER
MGSKGKKPILNDDDDSVDIDEMLKLVRMKHRRMFEEAAPPLVHRQGGVNGGGCDMSSSHMTRLCGGSLEDYVKDLNSAFSGMNMSGEKGIQKDLDDSFPLSDDQHAIREHFYLEKFVNSIVDEPNPNSLKRYHNISDSSSSKSNYRLNAPLSQHASDIQLEKIIRAQDHINEQAYLHTLRSSNAVALQQAALHRPGGNIDALGNSNVELSAVEELGRGLLV